MQKLYVAPYKTGWLFWGAGKKMFGEISTSLKSIMKAFMLSINPGVEIKVHPSNTRKNPKPIKPTTSVFDFCCKPHRY